MIGMTMKRWATLNESGEPVSDEEFKAGWHYCCEWDFLLVGPGMPEMDSCRCVDPPASDYVKKSEVF